MLQDKSIQLSNLSSLDRFWKPAIVLTALIFAVPVFTIASFLIQPSAEIWQHLVDTVLIDYLTNSALLMVGVGLGTFSIGVTCAWLTSVCQFPGKRFFAWALLLPLAMPAYIIAYTYTGMFDFAGPVQTLIREWTGWGRSGSKVSSIQEEGAPSNASLSRAGQWTTMLHSVRSGVSIRVF